jgi:hypothetical protein
MSSTDAKNSVEILHRSLLSSILNPPIGFLIAQTNGVTPLCGEFASEFCMLEAGYSAR